MTIDIELDQQVVGKQASRVRAAPILPEYSYTWVIDELDPFCQRPGMSSPSRR
jgi:formate C-acetyltransferase